MVEPSAHSFESAFNQNYFRIFLADFDSRYFWAWTDFQSYLEWVHQRAPFSCNKLILTSQFYAGCVGYRSCCHLHNASGQLVHGNDRIPCGFHRSYARQALFLHSYSVRGLTFHSPYLGLPQFLRNYKNKSTHGMSFLMVIMWTIGDVYKTTYFIMRRAPMQFYICGMLQVGIRHKNDWIRWPETRVKGHVWRLNCWFDNKLLLIDPVLNTSVPARWGIPGYTT